VDGAYAPTHFVGTDALLRTGTSGHAKYVNTTWRLRDTLYSSFFFIDIPGLFQLSGGRLRILQYLPLSSSEASIKSAAVVSST
jgi:hypothetical protein